MGQLTDYNQEIRRPSAIDRVFTEIIDRCGTPPAWRREPGFATLVQIILEQQVSLTSARATFDRLVTAVEVLTPAAFCQLDDGQLQRIGFSRQKSRYCRHLAGAMLGNVLVLDRLSHQTDDQVRAALTALPGIGAWTANIYLLMALQRPDIWPKGDIALAEAYRMLAGLAQRPTAEEMEAHSFRWRPWRSTAACLLWHYYLSHRPR